MKKIYLLLSLVCLASCYRMPGEDDYSLIPTVNNPSITNEKSRLGPGTEY